MIGVPDGGIGGRHSYNTSPMSSAHRRDRHRTGSFRRSPVHYDPFHHYTKVAAREYYHHFYKVVSLFHRSI